MANHRAFSVGFVMAAATSVAGCDSLLYKTNQALSTCENIRSDIIELSEKDRASEGYALVAIYEPTKVSKSEKELNCRGKAFWSDNDETEISYKQYLDQEGNLMLQYNIPE